MAKRPETGTATDWLTDRVLRGLIALLLALPYRRRVPFMGWVMRRVLAPVTGYRRRARRNLAHVWPDRPEAERGAIAETSLDNAGRAIIEFYSREDLVQQLAAAPVTGPGLAVLERARAAKTPVVLVTAHFGNHDGARLALNARGYEIGVIYRAMANTFFNRHYERTARASGGAVFEQSRTGTAGFVRHLKQGGMAMILFDLYHRGGPKIDFLGQPARTSTSAADLALRYNAPLVPCFCTRAPDGLGFTVEVEAPVAPADPLTMTREMTARLEARIHAHPGQWFWIHRRWKPAV